MKTLIIAATALLLTSATTYAQSDYATLKKDIKHSDKAIKNEKQEKREERKALHKLEGQEVSYQSKEQFMKDFGSNTLVEWKRTAFYDEATFQMDGQKTTAFYDIQNQLVGTTQTKQFSDLPASAQKTISKKYKDYSIVKVIRFNDNEANDTDMLLFGTQFDDSDNYFVEVQKDNKAIVLQVTLDGAVGYFTQLH